MFRLLVLLLLLLLLSHVASIHAANVPEEFDCRMREFAIEYAMHILPNMTRDQIRDFTDAINGAPEAQCRNLTAEIEMEEDRIWKRESFDGSIVVVSTNEGDDSNPGTETLPMKTVQAAIERIRNSPKPAFVLLRAGVYREESAIRIGHEDSGLIIQNYDARGSAILSGGFPLRDLVWKRWIPPKKATALDGTTNIWRSPVPSNMSFSALRVSGKRAIRARYPNADPETSLNPDGWITKPTTWLKPAITHETNPPVEYVVENWTRRDSTGNELRYQAGINGSCSHLDPPYGYWCSAKPNRTVDGSLTHRWPSGLVYDESLLPNAPYTTGTPVVHSCRGGNNCWFTWMFEVDAQNASDSTFRWTKGGFQGAEGSDDGGSWFVENALEELDAPREFFYDAQSSLLYYFHNATAGTPPPSAMVFESVELKTLLSVEGTQERPVKDVTIRGIAFQDTAPTYMDAHGLPSGGDWALHRSGALRVEGSERLLIDDVVMTRLDGNGISVNNYNRNLTVSSSEISWIGGTAIAAWGSTKQGLGGGSVTLPEGVGIDGTAGNQPRRTRIVGNIIREVGIWQKQSSMYFQAQSCETTIERNLFYNGPRALINFNDQFGGANRITENILVNACRETADHGPFNSWGRQPYITRLRDGSTPSITPADTRIDHNFVVASYHSQEAIDNDDASEYFETYSNFFVYGGGGLKSDFGGHSNRHHHNTYAFTEGGCVGVGSFLPGYEDAFHDNRCVMQSPGPYASFDCSANASSGLSLPIMGNNSVFNPDGSSFSICGMPFEEWQASGHDPGTTVRKWPSPEEIVSWGREALLSGEIA